MDEMSNIQPYPLSADAGAKGETPTAEAAPHAEGASRALPPDAMIVMPVRNVVLVPGLVIPLGVGRERSRAAVQEAVRLEQPIGILLQNQPETEEPSPGDVHWVGTSASVLRYITAPDGSHHAICKGLQRFRVLQFLDGWPFTVAQVHLIQHPAPVAPDSQDRAHALNHHT